MNWLIVILVLIWLFAEGITEAYRKQTRDMKPCGLDFHSWRLIHRGAISLALIALYGLLPMAGLLLFGNFMVYERSRSKFYRGKWFPHLKDWKEYKIQGITLKWNNWIEIGLGIIGLAIFILYN